MRQRLKRFSMVIATLVMLGGGAGLGLSEDEGGEVELQAHAGREAEGLLPGWVEFVAIGVLAALVLVVVANGVSVPPDGWRGGVSRAFRGNHIDDLFFKVKVLAKDQRESSAYLRSLDELKATMLTREPWRRGDALTLSVRTSETADAAKAVRLLPGTVVACRKISGDNSWYLTRLHLGHAKEQVRQTDEVLAAIGHQISSLST